VVWSGAYLADPRWSLGLSQAGVTNFDFNNKGAGRLSVHVVPNGAAIWTALGSAASLTQILRKDGNTVGGSGGPGAAVTGSYPLAIGATVSGTTASYQYTGELGEVLMFDRLLSAVEATEVEGYLACKWGLQNRLPANHPYRNVCPQGGTHPSMPQPTPQPSALPEPVQLRSQNGQLVFDVVASANAQTGNPQLTYNGSPVPPTLRLLPGDTLIVNLTNSLPVPPPNSGYLNDTSLHYHGLHVSPNVPGDDSIDMLAMPGQSLHYQIVIPANHPTGLYWYHSHAHGEAERQNLSGMSGALIIDGIAQSVPQIASMPERVIIVRDLVPAGQNLPAADRKQILAMEWAMKHSARGMSMKTMRMNAPVRGNTTAKTRNPFVVVDKSYRRFVRPLAAQHCQAGSPEQPVKNWTVNGVTSPSIGIRPGQSQFWRLVNAGSDTYLDAQVDYTQLQIVALDGVPLATPLTVSHYIVPPASRIEFIVAGPPSNKTSYLRTNCFDAGQSGPPMPAAKLAKIDPNTSSGDVLRHEERIAPRSLAHRPKVHGSAYIRAFVKRRAIARTQTLTYSDQNTINGQTYDPSGPAEFYAQSGTMEQWQVVNNSSQVHTFHIHQVHFLVQAIVGGTPIEQQNVGQTIDNINVPAATANGPGSVTLVMDFTDPSIIGTFLLHCHILSHEDAGMMAKVTIGTSPPLTTNAPPQGLVFASPTAPAQTVTVSGGKAPYSISGCTGVANGSVNGNVVTVTPTGAGACVGIVADSGGLTVPIPVTVQGVGSPISLLPNSLAFNTPTSPAQTSTIAGGFAPYAATGCGGIAVASVNGATLSVSPQASGTCTITVTDSVNNAQSLAVAVNSSTGALPADNVTFHQNQARQGWYQAETVLTSAGVGSSSFGLLGTLTAPQGMPAFGKLYSQPLYASNETIGATVHNLVIVSTATDQVYAFDDVTGSVVWERNFTNPAQGITQQSWSDTACSDVNPDVGITGTPVIDRNADTMFVVVPTKESGVFHQRLHAISLQNGSDALAPVEVSASVQLASGGTASTSAKWNFNRGALLEANGNIYIGLGSHCDADAGATHGWMLAYSATTLQPAGNAIDLTNRDTGGFYFLGSTWMSGFGPASDASGNIYFATGNGPWDGISNFSMSVLEVPGNLNLSSATYFTPATEAQDSNNDEDLGSGGVMLLPDGLSKTYPHLLLQGGKPGATGAQKYLLNRDNMGGLQSGDAGAVWHADTGGGMWGGPAYFRDGSGNSYVVYGGGSPLSTYLFDPSPGSFSVYHSANVGCLECRDGGSQPVVSSNGTTPGTAVAWALKTPGNSGGTISLYAFDALNMTTLFAGTAGTWTQTSGSQWIGGALVSPLVANGRVYVPTDGSVAIFGLSGNALGVRRSRVTK
ncbi:MAG: multicopper oxidase domain-containing protein, partial [Candidatus Eremiobacteraeota bacterium]|nr:multicopper oxidase domain-containing protein [Candidatus Eremiobacteraeota bacterium]